MKRKPSLDWVDLLEQILQGAPALPRAACRGADPRLFDGATADDRAPAIALCRRCPEIAPCAAWADEHPVAGVVAAELRLHPLDELSAPRKAVGA